MLNFAIPWGAAGLTTFVFLSREDLALRSRNQGGQASLSLAVTLEKIRIESRATVARGLAKFKDPLYPPVYELFCTVAVLFPVCE